MDLVESVSNPLYANTRTQPSRQLGDTLTDHLYKNLYIAEKFILLLKDLHIEITPHQVKNIIFACLFHDIGKACEEFQDLLVGLKGKEKFRHEAISFMEVVFFGSEYRDGIFTVLKHHNSDIAVSGDYHSILESFSGKNTPVQELMRKESQNFRNEFIKNELGSNNFLKDSFLFVLDEIEKKTANFGFSKEISFLIKKYKEGISAPFSASEFIRGTKKLKTMYGNIDVPVDFIITKSIFKICDEMASRLNMVNGEDFINAANRELDDLKSIFISSPVLSKDAEEVLNKVKAPRKAQEKILSMLDSEFKDKIFILNGSTGSGKTISAELISYRLNRSFVLFTAPTRFLSSQHERKMAGTQGEILTFKEEVRRLKSEKKSKIWNHTTDQAFYLMMGFKRELLLLNLIFNGVWVLDELDMFSGALEIKNIIFLIKLCRELNIPVVISSATFTETFKSKIIANCGFSPEQFIEFDGRAAIPKKRGTMIFKETSPLEKEIFDNISNGDNVSIYFNSNKKTQLFYFSMEKFIKSIDPNFDFSRIIVYNTRISEMQRKSIEGSLQGCLGKKSTSKGILAIFSPVAEMGVDVSFDKMYSEFAPLRSLEQRAGRLRRFEDQGRDDCVFTVFYTKGYDQYFKDQEVFKKNLFDIIKSKFNNSELAYHQFLENNNDNQEAHKIKDYWQYQVLEKLDVKNYEPYMLYQHNQSKVNSFNFKESFKYFLYRIELFSKKASENYSEFINSTFRIVEGVNVDYNGETYRAVRYGFLKDGKFLPEVVIDPKVGFYKK